MPKIVSLATALPPNRFTQAETRDEMARVCRGDRAMERLLPVFDRTGVEARHLVRPLEWYAQGQTFEVRNDVYIECGLDLAERAVRSCLERAGVGPDQVDHLFFVTTTGLATPSLDARVAARVGLRADVRRLPLFGLGCAGGAGAVIRAADVLRGCPGQRALVLSVELCSLIFSPTARSPTDLVGAALFGDGAAAALLAGDETGDHGPGVVETRTHLFREAPDLMGWRFTGDGMRLILSRDVPSFVATGVKPVVERFLADQGVAISDLCHHVLHPGGAKVMATYRSAFGFDEQTLDHAREAMRQYGNQSSASVLFMLHDLVASDVPRSGDLGLMMALGPGFAAEMLTLRW
jgi:alkylresorcinol/alkylpyrone synthase